MKKQLGNPGILSSWIKGFDFCKSKTSVVLGLAIVQIMCTSDGRHVYGLRMKNLDVHAEFPDAICSFTELVFLEIYHIPRLHGRIPSCIAKLTNLSGITIVETSLSGPVPSFSTNALLGIINLSSNRLSGTIPPSFSNLPNLNFSNLSSNYLTGTIPPGIFFQYVSRYPYAYPSLLLFNNNLTGEIPKSYGYVDFYTINVGNNQLYGDASFLFGHLKDTEFIVLAKNHFEFDFSNVELPELTSVLDLSHNKIYGKVPKSFASAYELWYPNLSFNRLCGELPQGGIMGRFSAAIFENNACLCEYPSPPCFNAALTHAPAPAPCSTPN